MQSKKIIINTDESGDYMASKEWVKIYVQDTIDDLQTGYAKSMRNLALFGLACVAIGKYGIGIIPGIIKAIFGNPGG